MQLLVKFSRVDNFPIKSLQASAVARFDRISPGLRSLSDAFELEISQQCMQYTSVI